MVITPFLRDGIFKKEAQIFVAGSAFDAGLTVMVKRLVDLDQCPCISER